MLAEILGILSPRSSTTASSIRNGSSTESCLPNTAFASSTTATTVRQHPFRSPDARKDRRRQSRRSIATSPLTPAASRAGRDPPQAARARRSEQRQSRGHLSLGPEKAVRIRLLQRERLHAGTCRGSRSLTTQYAALLRLHLEAPIREAARRNKGRLSARTTHSSSRSARSSPRHLPIRTTRLTPRRANGCSKRESSSTSPPAGTAIPTCGITSRPKPRWRWAAAPIDASWKRRREGAQQQLRRPARQPVQKLPRFQRKDVPASGTKARNLNKEFAYAEGKENQLAHWTKTGLLKGSPEPAKAPRAAKYRRSVDGQPGPAGPSVARCELCPLPQSGRSRSYDGARPVDSARTISPKSASGNRQSPPATARASTSFDIVPGKPEDSIVIYRLESTEPGVMMPELPRRMVPDEAVACSESGSRQMKDPSKQQATRNKSLRVALAARPPVDFLSRLENHWRTSRQCHPVICRTRLLCGVLRRVAGRSTRFWCSQPSPSSPALRSRSKATATKPVRRTGSSKCRLPGPAPG